MMVLVVALMLQRRAFGAVSLGLPAAFRRRGIYRLGRLLVRSGEPDGSPRVSAGLLLVTLAIAAQLVPVARPRVSQSPGRSSSRYSPDIATGELTLFNPARRNPWP